jgi:hypothetical protein
MDDLLANPAVQAGLAPFLLALAMAAALRRTRVLGLAVAAAFALVIALTIGYSFEPLTAVRKLVLAGLGTSVVLLALEALTGPTGAVRAAVAALAAGAAVWVLWRLLQQQQAARAALYGLAAAAYLGVLVDSSLRVGGDAIRPASASLVLGLSAGGLALLGASALLAQIGIAIGAGAGAVLLVQMTGSRRAAAGWTLVLPAAVLAGLAGLLAVFTASLPWFCLAPTIAIPWAARLVPHDRYPAWATAFLATAAALVPMLLALALAWFATGAAA